MLSATDFAAPADQPSVATSDSSTSAPAGPVRRVIDPETARGGASDVIVLTGSPATGAAVAQRATTPIARPADPAAQGSGAAASPAAPVVGASPSLGSDQRLQIDQLVGQINGRPVYADEFFESMDARFRREAERLSRRDWITMARKDIEAALWDKLRDELLLAEFQGALSPEERQGLFGFIENVRKDLVSGNLGSEALASQRLREAEGLGLEEKVEDVTQREFIAYQLRKAIGDRVNISARDIELYYEQNINEFVPPPVAQFVILRVHLREEATLAEAEAALASGESFEAICKRLSTWRPDDENRSSITITKRDYATATLFGPKALNDAALTLSPGQTTPRVDHAGDAYWIRLAAIESKPGKPLYEVQGQIEDTLKAQRIREEEVRYFEQLFRRGSFSDIKDMTGRLLAFAAERYLILGSPPTSKPPREGAAAEPAAPAKE